MGYQTTIVILNDAAHEIERDKNFPRNLYLAILQMASRPGVIDVPIGCHVNACQVITQEHADVEQVLRVGGNTARVIGHGYWSNSNHTLLRRLAEQHGFRLVKSTKTRIRYTGQDNCIDCQKEAPQGTCYDCKKPLNSKGNCPDKPNHRT